MTTATLILASRSAQRAQLLQQAGYRFVQADPPFQDPPQPPPTGQPETMVMSLASQKARSHLLQPNTGRHPNAVILSADTVVVGPTGTLLGQPRDREHAHKMLLMLINATHRVCTGVAVVDQNGTRVVEPFADWAHVQFGDVSRARLTAHLDASRWEGKAGGYHLFDLEKEWPWSVAGDPATVVGLPLQKLAPHLAAWSTLQPVTGGAPDGS